MRFNLKVFRSGVLFLLIVVALATTGAICSRKTTTNQTLTVWQLFDDEDSVAGVIQSFEQTNNVKINFVKKDPANYELDSLSSIASGTGPDVWMIKNDWVYKNQDKLAPLPANLVKKARGEKRTDVEIFKDTFVPAAVQNCIINNQIYSIPLYMDTLAIYYNRSLVNKALKKIPQNEAAEIIKNPSTTWDDLIRFADILTEKDGNNINVSGLALGETNVRYSEDVLSEIMLQNNTKILSDDLQTATFNLPVNTASGTNVYPGKNSLDFYTSFTNPSSNHYTWNNSMPESVDAFIQGKAAMIFGYQHLQDELKQKAPQLDYGNLFFPQIKGATQAVDYPSYWVYSVPKFAPNQTLAWKFILSFSTNSGAYLQKTGQTSSRIDSSQNIQDIKNRNTRDSIFNAQAQTAQTWNKGLFPQEIDKIFNTMISDVNSGLGIDKSIDKAASNTTTLLRSQSQ